MNKANHRKQKNIFLAAGGTGGHIYPALSIAKEIQHRDSSVEVYFIGTEDGLETRLIPQNGYILHTLSIGRINHNVSALERFTTLLKMPWAFVQALSLLLKFRPTFVMGFGGHASGPMLLMASLMGFTTYLWEPNAFPGLANRWLARFVKMGFVVYEEARQRMKLKKSLQLGMPIRKDIERKGEGVDIKTSELQTDKTFHVLIFGGSQGARAINEVVSDLIVQNLPELQSFRFVHQCGKLDFEKLKSKYDLNQQSDQSLNKASVVELKEYLDDMPQRYQWADLVVCRCGTGTLSELMATGVPGILIPLPGAADNHQQKNAESLVAAKASVMVLQKDFNTNTLQEWLLDFKTHPGKLKTMSQQLKKLHQPDSAEKIVDIIWSSS